MAGFQITDINFRQEGHKLPAGKYTFGMEVIPTGTSLTFGWRYKGSGTVNTETISDLTIGVRQYRYKTFTATDEIEAFYPARQIGAKVFKPTLNKGDKPIDPSASSDDVGYSGSQIKILKDQITLKVSQGDFQSAITLLEDAIGLRVSESDFSDYKGGANSRFSSIELDLAGIDLRVGSVEDGLEDTGINIQDKKVTITANKFEVYDNNGTPRAIFNENFKLDQFGNVELASVKTPIIDLTPTVSGNNLTVDWNATPNIILKSRPLNKGVINLPATQAYNGRQLIVVHDMFWAGNSGATVGFMDLKAGTSGQFLGEGFDGKNYIRMHSVERFVMKITGVWNSSTSTLNWAITDFADYTVYKTKIKAGEVLYSGYIDTNGNLTEYYRHVKFILNGSKVSNRTRLVVGQMLRVNSAGNDVFSTPSITSDLFIKIKSDTFTRASYINASTWELITFSISGGSVPIESLNYVYFEITAVKDMDLRNA